MTTRQERKKALKIAQQIVALIEKEDRINGFGILDLAKNLHSIVSDKDWHLSHMAHKGKYVAVERKEVKAAKQNKSAVSDSKRGTGGLRR